MPMAPGTRLGPYEVTALLGAGGMGEVYNARDTRLDRSVAIKVLPGHVSADPERRARFEREAKTVAGLNHSHICTLYDVGEHEGSTFLVMEHLTGETLAQRLEKGPLPLEQALTTATEIADALAAAHRQGVIHRDLKPGNVMLTKAGAKLLDFGLAKLKGHGEQPAAAHLASAPTQSTPLTGEGMIVGTLQYMAPEQLEGKPADARTDLWALGAILYEMVTGKRAFEGTSAASLIANIINAEPPALATLQPLTPPGVDRLVRRCLAKDPDARWQTACDLADELRWIVQSSTSQLAALAEPGRRSVWRDRTLWGVALAGAAVVGALIGGWSGVPGWGPPRGTAARTVVHLAVELPPDAPLWIDPQSAAPSFALSPDGSVIAYTCVRGDGTQICLRRLDRSEVSPIAGSEGGRYPVFSPDGQSVVFCVASGPGGICDPLKKLSVMDARVETLGRLPDGFFSLSTLEWAPSGVILLSGPLGIWQMSASGGPATPVVRADPTRQEVIFALPALLPDGQRLIVSVARLDRAHVTTEVQVVTVATGERRVLLQHASMARYLPTGHLLYLQGDPGTLVVAAFDPVRLVLGTPVPLWGTVRFLGSWPALVFSRTGLLLHLPAAPDRVLTWVDREQGSVAALPLKGPWGAVRLSSDSRRVAVEVARDRTHSGIAVVDLDRRVVTEVVREGQSPLWTRDGRRIAFASLDDDNLLWQSSDGSGTPEVLQHQTDLVSGIQNDGSWSPDGRVLAFSMLSSDGGEIWTASKQDAKWEGRRILPLPDSASPNAISPLAPRFSPDGRWLAYTSMLESAAVVNVWVRAYPGGDQRTRVSGDGGHDAVWSADGRELFYRNGDRFYAVPVRLTPAFSVGSPRLMFTGPYLDARFGGGPPTTFRATADVSSWCRSVRRSARRGVFI
jgi:Tol biopolymer transport system component